MTGFWLLDWATLSISLFNFILLTWLGFTVLLNADRRDWGVWLMSSGLLVGALFFICHTAILGQQEVLIHLKGLNFWWHVGWIPVIIAPLAWYVVALWYAGYWNRPRSMPLRHRIWLRIAFGLALLLIGLFVLSNPIPDFDQVINLNLSGTLMVGNAPLIFMLFPVFMIACIAFSIDIFVHPTGAKSPISEQARQRSRPWLFGTASILLIVSFLIAVFIFYVLYEANGAEPIAITAMSIAIFDFVLSSLLACAVVLLGQAIVSYEVFTGKALPRRSLVFHWRTAILIATGCSVLVGGSLALNIEPIYSLLLLTLLLIISYSVYTWRSFVAREQHTAQLRPFVKSEQLISSLLEPSTDVHSRAYDLFNAVCRNVLGTKQAQLIPLGSLAPLVGPPLCYPDPTDLQPVQLLPDWEKAIQPLDPLHWNGFCWSVPLWAERGPIGVILIGAKCDNGLYSQEEIEIARASGERIVDMLAAERMTARLMLLQRHRLTESHVMDFRTRRLLHDEVLPALHSTLLQVAHVDRDNPAIQSAVNSLIDLHGQIADLIHIHTPPKSNLANEESVDFAAGLRNVVNGEFTDEFETISWTIITEPRLDQIQSDVILGAAREVLRNAAIHGRGNEPKRALHLAISIQQSDMFELIISDDGVGLSSNLMTSNGSGNGLALHTTLLAIIGGQLIADSLTGGGTKVVISIPIHMVSQQFTLEDNSIAK